LSFPLSLQGHQPIQITLLHGFKQQALMPLQLLEKG
jgi:hypothetical protein